MGDCGHARRPFEVVGVRLMGCLGGRDTRRELRGVWARALARGRPFSPKWCSLTAPCLHQPTTACALDHSPLPPAQAALCPRRRQADLYPRPPTSALRPTTGLRVYDGGRARRPGKCRHGGRALRPGKCRQGLSPLIPWLGVPLTSQLLHFKLLDLKSFEATRHACTLLEHSSYTRAADRTE